MRPTGKQIFMEKGGLDNLTLEVDVENVPVEEADPLGLEYE